MCRTLRVDEIECRVATVSENGCSLLLYKTARVDRAVLTELYGNRWQNDFKIIDGKMYGGIAIYDTELKEWLWRWDCGTESNTEKEKGEASDCFKRAGFKWGIGIELYTAPFIFTNVPTVYNKEKRKWELVNKFEKFDVKLITYKDGVIDNLEIINSKNETVYKKGQVIKSKKETKPINQEQVHEKSAADELFPTENEETTTNIDADFDLIEELKNKKDIANLTKFFNENQKNAKNKAEFLKEFQKCRKKLQKGA